MANEETTERTRNKLVSSLPKRLHALVIGLAFLILAATAICVLIALKLMNFTPGLFHIWILTLLGPFAGLSIQSETAQWAIFGAINLLFIFAHPIWPNRITATITFLAFTSWLFWGFAIACSGV